MTTSNQENLSANRGVHAKPFTPSVLVIDDDAAFLKYVVELGKSLGFHTVGHKRVVDATTALKAEKFDVVFCDIQMPYTDGFEFIEIARAFNRDLPVIAITADLNLNDEDMKKRGAVGVLTKPFTAKDFRRAVWKYTHHEGVAEPDYEEQ